MAAQHAHNDLQLLKKVDPQNSQLDSFAAAPARNAEQILYTLLNCATAEEIRENRRGSELAIDKAEQATPTKEEPKEVAEKKNRPKPKKAVTKKPAAKKQAAKKSPSKKAKNTPT